MKTVLESLNKPLIKQCQSWADCIRKIDQTQFTPPVETTPSDRKMALLPSVSVAWYLSNFFPDLCDSPDLNFWIIGAELIDGRDSGLWYQSLSPLLGSKAVHVRLVGPNVPGDTGSGLVYKGPVEDLLEQKDIQLPDVAVIFHPGFEEEDGLLSSGLVSHLLSQRCIVLGSSYSEEEFARDRLMCRAYGYDLSDSCDNPFAIDPAETGLYWADRMWHFDPARIPSAKELQSPDKSRIDSVHCLSRMSAHSRLKGVWVQPAPPGSSFQIPDKTGGSRLMVHIMDNYYLDPASGQLYGVDNKSLRPCDISVSATDIQAMPKTADPLELALWAASIKSNYLVTNKKPTH